MKNNLTSFMSERTAEYIILPHLTNILGQSFKSVTPIFYWATREGNSNNIFSFSAPVKILSMYARRPKINTKMPECVYVKFNQLLFDRSQYLYENGIATIVGVPISQSLADLNTKTKTKLFEINVNGHEEIISFDINSSARITTKNVFELDAKDVIKFIDAKSQLIYWEDFPRLIKGMRHYSSSHGYFRSIFGDIYKPVYIILQ